MDGASDQRHDCMDAGGSATQEAKAEESRLAQPKAARRASAMDGASDQGTTAWMQEVERRGKPKPEESRLAKLQRLPK